MNPERLWIGNVEPVNKTELAEFYWGTDLRVTEIGEAFGIVGHAHKTVAAVGPAILKGWQCRVCDGPVEVHSRTDAEQRVRDLRAGHGGWNATCKACVEAERAARYRKYAAEREARRARQAELASMPYRDYLNTPEWADRRKSALYRAKYRCQTCSAPGRLHVHHRTYVRRGMERNEDLIVLCADCHEVFHSRRELAEAGRAA